MRILSLSRVLSNTDVCGLLSARKILLRRESARTITWFLEDRDTRDASCSGVIVLIAAEVLRAISGDSGASESSDRIRNRVSALGEGCIRAVLRFSSALNNPGLDAAPNLGGGVLWATPITSKQRRRPESLDCIWQSSNARPPYPPRSHSTSRSSQKVADVPHRNNACTNAVCPQTF